MGYVDLTVASNNSPSQSSDKHQALKVHSYHLWMDAQMRLLFGRRMMDLHQQQYLRVLRSRLRVILKQLKKLRLSSYGK